MRIYRNGVTCRAAGCNRHVLGWHHLCNKHQKHFTRHGHSDQQPLTQAFLRSYKERIKKWAMSPAGAVAMDAVVAQYIEAMEKQTREDTLASIQTERTGIKLNTGPRQAAALAAQAYPQKDPRDTVLELMALGLVFEEDDHCFKSDQAFRCAVVNSFLRGTYVGTKITYRPDQGRPIAATRYIKHPVVDALADVLIKAVVVHGVTLAKRWREKLKQEVNQKTKVREAIEASV